MSHSQYVEGSYVEADVLEEFRERGDSAGKGYQTIMNEALREYLNKVQPPLNEEILRRVIQEELLVLVNPRLVL